MSLSNPNPITSELILSSQCSFLCSWQFLNLLSVLQRYLIVVTLSQTMEVHQRTRLGKSSSCDSKFSISTLSRNEKYFFGFFWNMNLYWRKPMNLLWRELKTRPLYECRCDERLKTKTEESVVRGTGTNKDEDQVNSLDGKTDLLTSPVSRETGLEIPCFPTSDLLWVQITLRFSSLPCPQSPCHTVIVPVFQEEFFPREKLLFPPNPYQG
jgi:hypothetical protein